MAGYRAAIIGCGRTASLLEDDPLRRKPCTHMGHYRASKRIRVVAGADTDDGRRAQFRKRWRVRRVYADHRELLQAERPEIVSLTATARDRSRMFKHCVEAGVRAVWIEKAIATSLGEARNMRRLARRHGVVTVVNHPRRWDPEYAEARRLILLGRIGEPRCARVSFSGRLVHTGTHAFDLLRYLLGEVSAVCATPDPAAVDAGLLEGEGRVPDIGATGTLFFGSGAVAQISGCARRYFAFELEIEGTEGVLRIGNQTPLSLLRPAAARYASDFTGLRAETIPALRGAGAAPPGAIRELLAGLDGGERGVNDLDEGYKALEIALAMHESIRAGGATIPLPLRRSSLRIDSY